ncbi:MAG: OsmC family protein [Thermoleophilia bacterium]|jgi:uncharacterized OsmC-like protein|nr:OsmC family protein [Thermoleophilia bacterium]
MTLSDRVEDLRSRLRAEPDRARITVRTTAALEGGMRCEAPFRRHTVVADEPPSVGGTDTAPNPLELAIGSLATCQAITYQVWAQILGIKVDRIEVDAEGDIDVGKFMGTAEGAEAGFTGIRLRVRLTGPEDEARYRELEEAVDTHCPVLDLVSRPVPVERMPPG